MKLCQDCKHCHITGVANYAALCTYEPTNKINYVCGGTLGDPWRPVLYCQETRESDKHCGPEAKWFEHKDPAAAQAEVKAELGFQP